MLVGGVGCVAWVAAENAGRKVEKEVERVRMGMHKARGEAHSPPTPESVEWLNGLLKVVWGLVNPDMFVPYTDVRLLLLPGLTADLPTDDGCMRIILDGRGYLAAVPPLLHLTPNPDAHAMGTPILQSSISDRR